MKILIATYGDISSYIKENSLNAFDFLMSFISWANFFVCLQIVGGYGWCGASGLALADYLWVRILSSNILILGSTSNHVDF